MWWWLGVGMRGDPVLGLSSYFNFIQCMGFMHFVCNRLDTYRSSVGFFQVLRLDATIFRWATENTVIFNVLSDFMSLICLYALLLCLPCCPSSRFPEFDTIFHLLVGPGKRGIYIKACQYHIQGKIETLECTYKEIDEGHGDYHQGSTAQHGSLESGQSSCVD